MTRVIIFDVNETLLDVGALDPLFGRMFGDATARREWFGQMLQSAFVSTITQTYRDFGSIGMSALAMRICRRWARECATCRRTRRFGRQWSGCTRPDSGWRR